MKRQPYQDQLAAIGRQLEAQREQQRRERAERRRRTRARNEDRFLFARAMQDVTPLQTTARVVPPRSQVQPLPRQRWLDEQAVLQESLSDLFDLGTLLEVDGRLSFRRKGIGPDVPLDLRRGRWVAQAQLDLHGLRRDAAREALVAFLADAHRAGLRCVRIIHGKGLGSPGRQPVLKIRVRRWLVQKREVLAFVQAGPMQGGAGAVLVLLARPPHPQGSH